MRRARRLRRLGSLEWFEIAYRVYLAALVGGGVVLWLSGLVSDDPATASQIADLNEHGPAVIGAVRRAGHRLRAAQRQRRRPDLDRSRPTCATCCWRRCRAAQVLTRPVVQRLRSMAFTGAAGRRHRRTAGGPAAAGLGRGVGRQRGIAPARDRRRCSSPSP